VGSRVSSVPVTSTYDIVLGEVSAGPAGVSVDIAKVPPGTAGISMSAAEAYGAVRV
jgi:hypothetical protein